MVVSIWNRLYFCHYSDMGVIIIISFRKKNHAIFMSRTLLRNGKLDLPCESLSKEAFGMSLSVAIALCVFVTGGSFRFLISQKIGLSTVSNGISASVAKLAPGCKTVVLLHFGV